MKHNLDQWLEGAEEPEEKVKHLLGFGRVDRDREEWRRVGEYIHGVMEERARVMEGQPGEP